MLSIVSYVAHAQPPCRSDIANTGVACCARRVPFFVIKSDLFSINPKVWLEDGILYARTNLLLQILCLFFWERIVVVDRHEKAISIRRRYLWVLSSERRIPFRDISHFAYRCSSVTTGGWWPTWYGATNPRGIDTYTLDAVLRDESEVRLQTFRGEFASYSGYVGSFGWDSRGGVNGTQDEASRSYLDTVQAMTGRGLSKGVHRETYEVR